MAKPTPSQVYQAFKPFYDELIKFVEVLQQETKQRFKSTRRDHMRQQGKKLIFNKRYRAIFATTADRIEGYREDIKRLESLYYQAVEQINNDYNESKKPSLPIYMPQINDNDNLVKIQLHINKAHSSENFKTGESIPVALFRTAKEDEENDILEKIKYQLNELGYKFSIKEQGNLTTLSVSVTSICDDYLCDSLQLRNYTGSQIRASFFTEDNEGLLNKSSMQSVGIMIVPLNVEVYKSHERSRRTDALYTQQHPDEIIFDFIPEDFRAGRIYKVKK